MWPLARVIAKIGPSYLSGWPHHHSMIFRRKEVDKVGPQARYLPPALSEALMAQDQSRDVSAGQPQRHMA